MLALSHWDLPKLRNCHSELDFTASLRLVPFEQAGESTTNFSHKSLENKFINDLEVICTTNYIYKGSSEAPKAFH